MDKLSIKNCILYEALVLFSEKGYDGVSVVQIADAVGIKAPSLYKHYRSKQHIFDAIIEQMANRYEEKMLHMQMNGIEASEDLHVFMNIDEQKLIEMGKSIFLYFLHDDYNSKFRKMLMIEQYHNKAIADLLVKQYVDEPIRYQGALFSSMIESEFFKQEDPRMMAAHFYAPMFLLLMMCDNHKEREAEAFLFIEQHIKSFNHLYVRKEVL